MIIWLGRVNITTASGTMSLREILLRVKIPVNGVRHHLNTSNTTGYLGQTLEPFVVAPHPRQIADLCFQRQSRISDKSNSSDHFLFVCAFCVDVSSFRYL